LEHLTIHHSDSEMVDTHLCLGFANTLSWRGRQQPKEHLKSYGDLVTWSRNVNILTRKQAEQLLEKSKRHHLEAERIFNRAINLRDAIYRVFSAIYRHSTPHSGDLATLNRDFSDAMAKMQITQSTHGYVMTYKTEEKALDRMLWPIIHSAADLLTSDSMDRVRRCADEQCGWLFLDMSRNRSRRWCDMKDCGNRAKARRHYQRKRKDSEVNSNKATTK